MNTTPKDPAPTATVVRKAFLAGGSALMGVVSMAALSIAIKAWRSGENTTVFDFVMPLIFLFFFYRLLGSAYVAFTGTLAPWSYEVLKQQLGVTRKQP